MFSLVRHRVGDSMGVVACRVVAPREVADAVGGGQLEEHELATRRRVEGVREEADRIQAELAAAEEEWQEWAIARRRVGTVLAPDGGSIAVEEVVSGPVAGSTSRQAARARSQVPVWRRCPGVPACR
jgi:hypothetical protein